MNRVKALLTTLTLVVGVLIGAPAANARPQAATALQPITHVVLIMEENHSYSETYGSAMPYLTSLANKYGVESNEHSIGLPSLPNYIALTSGNTTKAGGGSFIGTDCSPAPSCESSSPSIFGQASWHVLAESMPSNCDKGSSGQYAVRHTAGPYYTKVATACKTSDIPYSKTNVPDVSRKYTLIAPNLCNDAHDCGLSTADSWLKTVVPKIMSKSQYTNGSTLIEVTFDSGGPNNTVETVLINPRIASKKVTVSATHYSLLRLSEEVLGVPLLGKAGSAPDYRAAFGL